MNIYQQAVDEGAELIIGPLDKEAVRQLAREPELPVTTLALNYAEPPLSNKLYQFTLSPEREARQVAERAWLEGHMQAAVIVPQGSLGERMNAAFSERWEELGGRIVSRTTYPQKQNDYSHQLRRLLNLDLSDARRRSLARAIGTSPDFTPRRRQDVDFIFLAAFPRQARLLRPQLRFHHASDLPIYSTSYAFSGEVDRNKDRDMDGIAFLDMPWTLGVDTPNSDLRKRNAAALARHNNQLQRLVAMGVDAFTLSRLLRFLEHFPYEHYQGETGKLSVLGDHQVRNKMLWARFQYGRPRLMEEISAGDDSDDELY